MPEGVKPEVADAGTQRPKCQPLRKEGTAFEPLNCPKFDFKINLPPTSDPGDPYSIFSLYFSDPMLDIIVENTNKNMTRTLGPQKPYARIQSWVPLTRPEIYVYFGIQIYMGIHLENKISDYWNTNLETPDHFVRHYMSRNRFEAIHRYISISDPLGDKSVFARVSIKPILIYITLY